MTPKATFNPKVVRAMTNLQAFYNKGANKTVQQTEQEKATHKNLSFLIDLAIAAEDKKTNEEQPKNFYEAWNHPNGESQRKWCEAIQKEFHGMLKQWEWLMMSNSLMPKQVLK